MTVLRIGTPVLGGVNDEVLVIEDGRLGSTATPVTGRVYDVTRFGARGDDSTINDPFIAAAIAAAVSAGGGVIVFPPGIYRISIEITLANDNLDVVVMPDAVIKQMTYGYGGIDVQGISNWSITGGGKFVQPVDPKPAIPNTPLYRGEFAYHRMSGIYVYGGSDYIIDDLYFDGWAASVYQRPVDGTTDRIANARVSNIRTTRHEFGVFMASGENFVYYGIQGTNTVYECESSDPPHTMYFSAHTGWLHSRNVTVAACTDEGNHVSSSYKFVKIDGLTTVGLLSRDAARGIEYADCTGGTGSACSVTDMYPLPVLTAELEAGLNFATCTGMEIVNFHTEAPDGGITDGSADTNNVHALLIRDDCSNIIVRGGTFSSGQTSASGTSPIFVGGEKNRLIEIEHINRTSIDKTPITVGAASTEVAIIRPRTRTDAQTRLIKVGTTAEGAIIELDISTMGVDWDTDTITDDGTNTVVSFVGAIPKSFIANLPPAWNYPGAQFILPDSVPKLAISDDSFWRYADGTPVTGIATQWARKVIANGGTVSAGRITAIQTMLDAMETAGSLARAVDIWILAAENEIQALTSLLLLQTATKVNSPSFTIDRGYTFNGTTNYIDTGFYPVERLGAGDDLRAAVYQRDNVPSAGFAFGCTEFTARGIELRTQNTSHNPSLQMNCTSINLAVATDGLAYTSGSRTAAGVFEFFKRGVSLGTVSPGTTATVLPSSSPYIGCLNNQGVASNFLAGEIALVLVGRSLDDAPMELGEYNGVQAFATTVGFNV